MSTTRHTGRSDRAAAHRHNSRDLSADDGTRGSHRMPFTNFGTGKSHSFGGKYIELTPHERIRYSNQFDDPPCRAR